MAAIRRAWCSTRTGARCAGAPVAIGCRPLRLPAASGPQLLPALLQCLAARGMRRVLVEGGAITVSHFVAAGLLDRLHVVVAPFLMGSGKPALQLPPITTLEQALRPPARCYRLGADQLYDLDMRGIAGGSASTST